MRIENPLPVSSPAARLLDEIRRAIPRPTLAPESTEKATAAIVRELDQIGDDELLGKSPLNPTMVTSVRAGLLLRADWLDLSHAVSQSIQTPEGSYWHGIMHRREPDYGNSKYWFRRTGEHPVFHELSASPSSDSSTAFRETVTSGLWDPFRFVDLCEACDHGGRTDLRAELEGLQEREMDLLLRYCSGRAFGE